MRFRSEECRRSAVQRRVGVAAISCTSSSVFYTGQPPRRCFGNYADSGKSILEPVLVAAEPPAIEPAVGRRAGWNQLCVLIDAACHVRDSRSAKAAAHLDRAECTGESDVAELGAGEQLAELTVFVAVLVAPAAPRRVNEH